jgi:hypothetical protein
MSLRTALARVFGVAALLAALAFAPSVAEAHAGHVHKSSGAVAASVALPGPAVFVAKISALPDHAVHDQAVHDQTLHDHMVHDQAAAELRTAADVVPSGEPGVCGQGCCTGAPCHSCTACTLSPDTTFVLPLDAGENLIVWNVTGVAGCDPDGIRKPPRTFA